MRVVFFGSPAFAVPSLELVAREHELVQVVTQPDRPAGRGRGLTPPAVKVAATALGVAVMQPTGVRDPAFAEELRRLAPDVFVVVAYGRILPQALLDVPARGSWNVHASWLPALRGAAPIQWAVIRGLESTGVSVMRMEAGLDTGPVALQEAESVRPDDTAASLAARLAPRGAVLMGRALALLAAGQLPTEPQDHTQASWAPPLKKEDGHLRWDEPAHAVSCRARGVDPWPGAFGVRDGVVVKVFGARVVPGQGPPGAILALGPQGMVVACGADAVAFADVQLPGRQRMTAEAVARGRALEVGQRLV